MALFKFLKSCFGFAVPFFLPSWTENGGLWQAYTVQAALSFGVGAIVAAGLLVWGGRLRRLQVSSGASVLW